MVPSDAVRYLGPFQQFFSDEGVRERPLVRVPPPVGRVTVARPARFSSVRWLGDKRTMVVHDLDSATAGCGIDGWVGSVRAASFGPDTVVEARNRGYCPCERCVTI